MSKKEALEICKELWIVDGSDLQRYREFSRRIYAAFREAVFEIGKMTLLVNTTTSSLSSESNITALLPCRHGCMDEMMVDLSKAVDALVGEFDGGESILERMILLGGQNSKQKLFIFGEDSTSAVAHLVEDQTGVQTTVSYSNSLSKDRKLSHFRRNVHETHNGDKTACCDRFRVASRLAEYICQYIERKTQFHTTTGIGVSPLLAKIAGGLYKPKSINVLYPWRSSDLLYAMPLRKMNNVGYRSFKALQLAIEDTKSSTSNSEDVPITVRDLLEVPQEYIIERLSELQQGSGR
jgi:nucleotidyltransferase/DNA polymerase involved in DNA repair